MAVENTVTQIFQIFSLLTAQAWLHGKCQWRALLLWWIAKPLKSKCTWKRVWKAVCSTFCAIMLPGYVNHYVRRFASMPVAMLLCKAWYSEVRKHESTDRWW